MNGKILIFLLRGYYDEMCIKEKGCRFVPQSRGIGSFPSKGLSRL
jgi:hypothetical protein